MHTNLKWRASIGTTVCADKVNDVAIFTIYHLGGRENVNLNNVVEGAAAGYAIARGFAAATASVAITTGLTTITSYGFSDLSDSAAKANAAVLTTGYFTGGTLTAYRWKNTSSTTATLVAATTGGSLGWLAVGTI